jgi:hypothetical protein
MVQIGNGLKIKENFMGLQDNVDPLLILYSGGVDSTVLLKYCLERQSNPLKVIYFEISYNKNDKINSLVQAKAVKNCINYFKQNYREFDFNTIKLEVDLLKFDSKTESSFWKDDQWCAFFSGKICETTQIKNVLIGHFTYNSLIGILCHQRVDYWYYDNSLVDIFKSQISKNKENFHYLFPHLFQGKGIDEFKTKLEAWNYLDKELQENTRVCIGEVFHCGNCQKCLHLSYYNIRNNNERITII